MQILTDAIKAHTKNDELQACIQICTSSILNMSIMFSTSIGSRSTYSSGDTLWFAHNICGHPGCCMDCWHMSCAMRAQGLKIMEGSGCSSALVVLFETLISQLCGGWLDSMMLHSERKDYQLISVQNINWTSPDGCKALLSLSQQMQSWRQAPSPKWGTRHTPSRAYCGAFSGPSWKATVVSRPWEDGTILLPVFSNIKHPVPYVFLASPVMHLWPEGRQKKMRHLFGRQEKVTRSVQDQTGDRAMGAKLMTTWRLMKRKCAMLCTLPSLDANLVKQDHQRLNTFGLLGSCIMCP